MLFGQRDARQSGSAIIIGRARASNIILDVLASMANWPTGLRIATKTRFGRRQKLSTVRKPTLLFDVLSRERRERSGADGTSCFAGPGKENRTTHCKRRQVALPRLQIFSWTRNFARFRPNAKFSKHAKLKSDGALFLPATIQFRCGTKNYATVFSAGQRPGV